MEIMAIPSDITCNELVKQLDRNRYDWPLMLVMSTSAAPDSRELVGSNAFICINNYNTVALILRNPRATYRGVFYPRKIDFEEVRSILLSFKLEDRAYNKLFEFVKRFVEIYGSTHDGLVSAFRSVGIEDIYQYLIVN